MGGCAMAKTEGGGMIAFKRDTSGLYLAEIPANARVVFLFPGSVAHRPDLRSDRPGLDRFWPAWLHRLLRAVGNTRLGRFRGRRPQGLRCQCRHADRLVPRAAEHRAGPGLDHRTRYVVTNRCGILLADIPAKRDVPGPAGFVRTVDDGAVRGRVQQSADRQQPAGHAALDGDAARRRHRHVSVASAIHEPGAFRAVRRHRQHGV